MPRKTVKIATLDATFSLAIREQYDYTCAFANCEYCENQPFRYNGGLDCAHYYRRYRASGRWHPDNCAALCRKQHNYLDEHHPRLVACFTKLLGEGCHDALIERHHKTFRYKPHERWEMNRHYKAQTEHMFRLRTQGRQGFLPMVPYD